MQQFIDLLKQMPIADIAPLTNTIGHIFRHEEKENFISDWLAFLLNPEYTGNSAALSALLQLAGVTEPVDFSDISIIREYAFNDQRRIDFLIETSTHIIGIENKIWSGLQENQLKDYKINLSSNNKTLVLILLYPQQNKSLPVNSSDDLHTFHPVTYEDLVAEFRKIRFNIFENLRATILMEDFITHMEEYIMSKTDTTGCNIEMWNFEANYASKIHKLTNALKESKKQFRSFVEQKMSAVVHEREDFENWIARGFSGYYQLYKSTWANAQVHFELITNTSDLAPTEIQVVLHTHELGDKGKTKVLRELGGKAGKTVFSIDYQTEEDFQKSIDAVFNQLNNLVCDYSDIIDAEIHKAAIEQN